MARVSRMRLGTTASKSAPTPRPYRMQSRRPNVELIRQVIKELMDLEPDEHLSHDPRYRSLRYISLSTYARDQLVRHLTDCVNWVEHPSDIVIF